MRTLISECVEAISAFIFLISNYSMRVVKKFLPNVKAFLFLSFFSLSFLSISLYKCLCAIFRCGHRWLTERLWFGLERYARIHCLSIICLIISFISSLMIWMIWMILHAKSSRWKGFEWSNLTSSRIKHQISLQIDAFMRERFVNTL